jgi:hypothetical protein
MVSWGRRSPRLPVKQETAGSRPVGTAGSVEAGPVEQPVVLGLGDPPDGPDAAESKAYEEPDEAPGDQAGEECHKQNIHGRLAQRESACMTSRKRGVRPPDRPRLNHSRGPATGSGWSVKTGSRPGVTSGARSRHL